MYQQSSGFGSHRSRFASATSSEEGGFERAADH
jgi:hypothetical protein